MKVFNHSDREYLSWLQTHPSSYVVNTERRTNTKYFVLHNASCPYISTTNGVTQGGYTERNYIKIGSDDLSLINSWLLTNKPNFSGLTKTCQICAASPNAAALINQRASQQKAVPSVNFENIAVGAKYDRDILASLWGYNGRQAISRGVITPTGSNVIVLFVTKEKQATYNQYKDYISGDYLYWEGEEKGASNKRIINAFAAGDVIHLFYRERHHTDFTYKGILELEDFVEHTTAPMEAVFRIIGQSESEEETAESAPPISQTTRKALVSSRVGQGIYRSRLVKLWGACSVTGADLLDVLVASHIKPWKDSDNRERLDGYNGFLLTPNLDSLFDKGLISFDDNGVILISKKLSSSACHSLGLASHLKLSKVHKENIPYLEYHRAHVFLG